MIKLHIYDMDGTMLDSMWMWDELCPRYLMSIGIEPEPGLAKILDPMTMPEALDYMMDRYHIPGGADQIMNDIMAFLADQYENQLELFDGISEELKQLYSEEAPLIVFSNTPFPLLKAALTRTGVFDYFTRFFTTEEVGINKDDPDSFRFVCKEMGVEPEYTLVHEDSDYAANAAKVAGCQVKWYDKNRGKAKELGR